MNVSGTVKRYKEYLLGLFFPPLCVACKTPLLHQENTLCATCLFHLPINDHHLFAVNDAVKRFWGKTDIIMAASYLSFTKSSLVQTIVHDLKYKGNRAVGYYLGVAFGKKLLESPFFKEVELIVPIPLHKKKKQQRGYNQSADIAKGIADAMGLPMDSMSLIRVVHTESQTKKQGMERFDNMENVFTCANPKTLEGKHILLVDDVLTTGATMASAAEILQKMADCKISVATIAIA